MIHDILSAYEDKDAIGCDHHHVQRQLLSHGEINGNMPTAQACRHAGGPATLVGFPLTAGCRTQIVYAGKCLLHPQPCRYMLAALLVAA